MEILEIHNLVFDFLTDWSENTSDSNKYFYIKDREDEDFYKGFWFPGNNHQVEISFWTGIDYINRTHNIFFSIHPNEGLSAFLVAKDSIEKKAFFEKLVTKLDGFEPINPEKNIWQKQFGAFNPTSFLDMLHAFIAEDKIKIDAFLVSSIDSNKILFLENEFSSSLGFIESSHFYKLINRVRGVRIANRREEILSEILDFDSLPISLANIKIEHFHGIKKLSLNDIPENTKWIFLTGENGFGKSSLLQAIGVGLSFYADYANQLRENTLISIGYINNGKYVQNIVTNKYDEDFKDLNGCLIAYGPNRLVAQASSSENQESNSTSNIYHLFNKDGLMKSVTYLIKNSLLKADKTEFYNLKKAIITILNNRISDITIDEESNVLYHELDDDGKLLGKNKLEHLATGFQSLINLVGDIIVRFSKQRKSYHEFSGIVMIDELENHLHPIFQKKLPSLLSTLFPNVQFITSVHSPIPLLGAPKESVIIKVHRDADADITAERIVIDNIETLNPNILFTSPIFGFTSISSDSLIDKSKFRTEDTWNDMQHTDDLDKRLKELYQKRKAAK